MSKLKGLQQEERKKSSIEAIARILMKLTAAAVGSFVAYKLVKYIMTVIDAKSSPVPELQESLEESVIQVAKADGSLDKAVEMSKEALQAIITQDWEKAYEYVSSTIIELFKAKIALQDARVALAASKVDGAKTELTLAQTIADKDRFLFEADIFDLLGNKTRQKDRDDAVAAAKVDLTSYQVQLATIKNEVKVNKSKLNRELNEWINKRGTVYNMTKGTYVSRRTMGESDKTVRKDIKQIAEGLIVA